MGKIKKNKETTKPAKLELTKVSNKTALKSKKSEKTRKLEKKIKVLKPKVDKNTSRIVKGKELVPEIEKQLKKAVQSQLQDALDKDIASKKQTKGLTPKIEQQFKKAVEALLQYEEKYKNKDLFKRDKPLFVQIDSIKIPICPSRRLRIPLKHSLLTDKQEVCLIVPDLKRGRGEDHEPTIEHYEELLRSKNIKTIKRILPMRQLRVEYDQFELKRRLCGYYDYFLVAGTISGHAHHLLGKIFYEKRKEPIPIKMDAPNLGETIENSLKKVSLHIHPKGSSFIVQFGHSEMTSEQLTDNLKSVANKLVADFPGGWDNIRSLHIRTDKSISIPVYYTLKNPNKVNVPVIKPIRPKNFEKITDELSTRDFNSKVTVHPGGKVDIKKKRTGVSKNQLRKTEKRELQQKNAKLRAKKLKLKAKKDKLQAKKDKLKAIIKNENIIKDENVKPKVAVKDENVKPKVSVKDENEKPKVAVKDENVKPKQETVETVSKKQKKTKKQKVQSEVSVKQEKTETKKQKKSKTQQATTEVETNEQKKVKKQKNKKPATEQNLQKIATKTVNNDKKAKVKKSKKQEKM